MPQYLSPGVYVEELASAIQPIAGVGTSTAGFIGTVPSDIVMPPLPGETGYQDDGTTVDPATRYTRAANDQAVLITSWDAFQRSFGQLSTELPGNVWLGNAVYGFFNNGGTRCWVASVSAMEAATDVEDALASFATIDEIALVAAPGATAAPVQDAIVAHCSNLADRFAILDGQQDPASNTPAAINTAQSSSYGAIYYPWIDIGLAGGDGKPLYLPPSGHIAGVYARVDSQRGVFKAPANEVIQGALDVQARLSKADQDGLNPAGVNVIRMFGNNVTIWGARTMVGTSGDAEWTYISARRLFIYLRESIEQGTQWAVFEPNGPDLWQRVRRNVGAFLTTTWQSGALLGDTAAQAFYVQCDATTNSTDTQALGQLITEVGVALVQPAEFVIFRISQWSGPASS
ncbi:MAG TPA: phage tail sheath subtilisin-like domain-containing protein [Trebonia sp.]|jgi:hypothetical protein|nr:phage tail sheath subtilisin-like domain-containing protein [Trebonia sp.]